MTEQPINQKCRHCGAETVGSDVCWKCIDNPTRQESLENIRKAFCEQVEQHAGNLENYKPPKVYPDYAIFCDNPEEQTCFKPARVAKWLMQYEQFKTDRKNGILYYGDVKKGVWTQDGETVLQEILSEILGEENRVSHYNNILHALKGLTYCNIEFSKKIAVDNGLLDVETGELTPFTLEEMAFYSIPTTYNKEANCPQFKEFLKQVLAPEDILTLQEWSGYLLLPDYREHKIMWLHGNGRNGKGTWTRTMESILGPENCSSVDLQQFDGYHRFAMERLYGKLFNTCNEPAVGSKKVLQTSLLKAATGQDTIDAEIKGKQKTVKFRNVAKITVIANRFPKVEDNTTAFRERRLFVTFPHEYIGKEKINNLEEVWLNDPIERMGILNWMLEGLHRILKQGYFTEGKTQKETEILFQRSSDTIGAFLTEMVIFDKTKYRGRAETFEAYKKYCDFYGLENEEDKALVSRLRNTPKINEGKRLVNGKRERCWIGIDLIKLPEDEENGSDGTDGTVNMDSYTCANLEESKELEEGNTRVPSVPNRVCGVCELFHKPSCVFPAVNFDMVPEDSKMALDCRSFTPKKEGSDD